MLRTLYSAPFLIVPLLALSVVSCGPRKADSTIEDPPAESATQVVGDDRDEHGCIGSAGYQWCEATETCERPWELAENEGFENTAEAFAAFCAGDGAAANQ